MGIKLTEAQFEEMTNGTIHEGKYAVAQKRRTKSTTTPSTRRKPLKRRNGQTTATSTRRKPLKRRNNQSTSKSRSQRTKNHDAVANLASSINTALPWMLGMTIFTSPLLWIIVAFLALLGPFMADMLFTIVFGISPMELMMD